MKKILSTMLIVFCLFLSSGCIQNLGYGEPGKDGADGLPGESPDNATFIVEYITESGNLGPVGVMGNGPAATKYHHFTVNEGAVAVTVVCDGSNGTSGRGDIDMNVYGPKEPRKYKSSGSGGSYEMVELTQKDIEKRFGFGEYDIELIEYAGLALSYTLHIYIYFPENLTAPAEE